MCRNVPHHRILSEIIVRSSRNGVQLHQIVKIGDLPVHPFLMKEREQTIKTTTSNVPPYAKSIISKFSDLSESRCFEQFLRRACGLQRERSQQKHSTVDFITHLSYWRPITRKEQETRMHVKPCTELFAKGVKDDKYTKNVVWMFEGFVTSFVKLRK